MPDAQVSLEHPGTSSRHAQALQFPEAAGMLSRGLSAGWRSESLHPSYHLYEHPEHSRGSRHSSAQLQQELIHAQAAELHYLVSTLAAYLASKTCC